MYRTLMHYRDAIACALVFALVAGLVVEGSTLAFDTASRSAIHRLASGDLTRIALVFTFMGSAWIWVPATTIVAALLWFGSRRKAAIGLGLGMFGAVVLDNGLKLLFHRARPLGFFVADPRTYSFPSGHALFAACFYGALATVLAGEVRSAAARRVLWATAIVAVLCIGWSRIYLGVHYVSDVIGGYLAGAAWVELLRAAGALPAADKNARRIG